MYIDFVRFPFGNGDERLPIFSSDVIIFDSLLGSWRKGHHDPSQENNKEIMIGLEFWIRLVSRGCENWRSEVCFVWYVCLHVFTCCVHYDKWTTYLSIFKKSMLSTPMTGPSLEERHFGQRDLGFWIACPWGGRSLRPHRSWKMDSSTQTLGLDYSSLEVYDCSRCCLVFFSWKHQLDWFWRKWNGINVNHCWVTVHGFD